MDFVKLANETKKLTKAKFVSDPPGLEARRDFNSNPLTALYYQFVQDWLDNKITKPELIAKLIRADRQYAKRQMTWFKKDPRVVWLSNYAEARSIVRRFLMA